MISLAGKTRAILRRTPEAMPLKGIEVGVFNAGNSEGILQERPYVNMALVDLFTQQEPEGLYARSQDVNSQWTNETWGNIFLDIAKRMKNYHGRYYILQQESQVAARAVEDSSVDFCFIDANHMYEAVKADIQAWLPKVKRGGWIGGHDYHNTWGGRWGVSKAVTEWVNASNRHVELDEDDTWFVWL